MRISKAVSAIRLPLLSNKGFTSVNSAQTTFSVFKKPVISCFASSGLNPKGTGVPVPREIKSYAKGTVHKNSHIYFSKDKHYYSVAYKHIGKRIKIIYSESLVEIFHKLERLAVHPRERKKYAFTTIKEHMPSHHRFISEWSSEKFIAWAGHIGENCKAYIIKILDKKQHPEQSYKSCLGVLHLTKKVGNVRLDNTCKRAMDYGAYNYNIIERILKNGWDALDENIEQEIDMPNHSNIRGGHYYK